VKHLRWLAVAPLVLGILFLFVAMLWTSVVQGVAAVALFAIAAGVWRAFAGRWPPEIRVPSPSPR
jgi:membrane protein implicated in regulation of membrane protease activity